MAREWAQVPAYRESLAADTRRGARAPSSWREVERRAAELHPAARRLFGNWLDLADRLTPAAVRAVCTKLFSRI